MLIKASEDLKNDRDVVLAAVKQNAKGFEYISAISEDFRIDSDVRKAAGLGL